MRDEEAKDVKRPFFSVIVPAHNSEEYIMKGLQSVMDQDFEDYELIVVCDSCTDRTALAAYMFTDNVICTDFHSAGGARNAGLDAAKGEWVLFMDDDDWYLPGAFSKIAEAVKQQDEIDHWPSASTGRDEVRRCRAAGECCRRCGIRHGGGTSSETSVSLWHSTRRIWNSRGGCTRKPGRDSCMRCCITTSSCGRGASATGSAKANTTTVCFRKT